MERTADQTSVNPYPSSWIDWIVRWIDRIPISAWLFYLIALGLSVLLNNAVFWLDGALSFGSFDPDLSIFAVFVMYWIALYHYLTRVASESLLRFRPLLRANDGDMAVIDFKLVNLPRNLGLLALLIGVVISFADTSEDLSATIGPLANSAKTIMPTIYFSIGTAIIGAAAFSLFIRTIRQLRLVGKLHGQASGIDLLSLAAPHAFSRLTSRTGLGLILLLVLIVLPAPWQIENTLQLSVINLALYVLIALLAVAVFVIPLEGMHSRLRDEKGDALHELDELYRSAQERLYRDVRDSHYEEMGQTKEALGALMIHRERLDKISTWPWDSRTIRGFSSALLLPIFLLLVAQLLERLF